MQQKKPMQQRLATPLATSENNATAANRHRGRESNNSNSNKTLIAPHAAGGAGGGGRFQMQQQQQQQHATGTATMAMDSFLGQRENSKKKKSTGDGDEQPKSFDQHKEALWAAARDLDDLQQAFQDGLLRDKVTVATVHAKMLLLQATLMDQSHALDRTLADIMLQDDEDDSNSDDGNKKD